MVVKIPPSRAETMMVEGRGSSYRILAQVGRHGWLKAELENWVAEEFLEEKQTDVHGHSAVIKKTGLNFGYWNPVVCSGNVVLSHVLQASLTLLSEQNGKCPLSPSLG